MSARMHRAIGCTGQPISRLCDSVSGTQCQAMCEYRRCSLNWRIPSGTTASPGVCISPYNCVRDTLRSVYHSSTLLIVSSLVCHMYKNTIRCVLVYWCQESLSRGAISSLNARKLECLYTKTVNFDPTTLSLNHWLTCYRTS